MKKTRLFKRLTVLMGLVLVLTLSVWLLTSPAKAYAEEVEETTEVTTEVPETSVIDTATAFFEDKILPILLGLGGTTIMGIVALPYFLRKIRKATNTLKTAETEITRLKGVMTTYAGVENKLNEIKTGTEYDKLVRDSVTAAVAAALKTPLKAMADLSGDMSAVSEDIKSLKNAAGIVWGGKPGATQALNTVSTATALRKRENEIQGYKRLLRIRGDADVEKLISEVEEAANNE